MSSWKESAFGDGTKKEKDTGKKVLSPEQLERIKRNREAALKRLAARRKQQASEAAINVNENERKKASKVTKVSQLHLR